MQEYVNNFRSEERRGEDGQRLQRDRREPSMPNQHKWLADDTD